MKGKVRVCKVVYPTVKYLRELSVLNFHGRRGLKNKKLECDVKNQKNAQIIGT